jgi:zinc transport system ATP-binding protein
VNPEAPKTGAPAVSLEHLTVFYGQAPALSDITLEVAQGEYMGIVGPNGGGKSTLLKAILGLVTPASGRVFIEGKPVWQSRGKIGYVPQVASMDKRFPITVTEVVLGGRIGSIPKPFFRYSREDRELASCLLAQVGLEKLAHRQIAALSGGEFQKMLIARALATCPRLLLLDEPTANVDARSREQIYSLLAEFSPRITVLLVTHDLAAVSQAHSLACMNGRLMYRGDPVPGEKIFGSLYGCATKSENRTQPVDFIPEKGGQGS